MKLSGEDITGSGKQPRTGKVVANNHGKSLVDPANEKTVPSYVEDVLDQLVQPNPPDEEIYIGPKPSANAIPAAILQRHKVIDWAKSLTNRVGEDKLKRIADALFNDSFSLEHIKKIAAFDVSSPETLEHMREVLEAATGAPTVPTADDVEALVVVARAVLHHIMVDHSADYRRATIKTPFMAWRIKEIITEGLLKTALIELDGDTDNRQQCKELQANFSVAELVLWNVDIWKAALRNAADVFMGKPLTKEIINAAIPMFWQFELPLAPDAKAYDYFQLPSLKYDCAGIVIMPTVDNFLRVEIPAKNLAEKIEEKEGKTYITIDTNNASKPMMRAFEEALDADITIAKRGLSVSFVFLPIKGGVPEIRTLPAVFEGELINSELIAKMVAALSFLSQKFVVKDKVDVSRKELKQDRQLFKAVRKGKTQVPPIKIINLRRAERKEHDKDDDTNEPRAKRVLTCHSLVSSHWKNQWYPSQGIHKPIYVLTYVRGDTSKPFRPPRPKIYKAVR